MHLCIEGNGHRMVISNQINHTNADDENNKQLIDII